MAEGRSSAGLGSTASTGIAGLDHAINGLFWGDNVVWESRKGASAEPFYRAAAALADRYDVAAFVTVGRSPEEVRRSYPKLDVIDARPGRELGQPADLLADLRTRCAPRTRGLLLFDSMEAMADAWGTDLARRFFLRCCPMLLDLGAVGYWSLARGSRLGSTRREMEESTQCVLVLGGDRLRIAKAEGRPPGVEGAVHRVEIRDDGLPAVQTAPAAARIGAALLGVRTARGLTQSDLARIAGVSPSAISQAERGQRGLSLETLLALSDSLGISLDELVRGEVATDHRLARRHDPRDRARANRPLALLDDPRAGLRMFLVLLDPRATATPHVTHQGLAAVAVASGLVQVVLATRRPALRATEALLVTDGEIHAFRNLGETPATLFWTLRDG